MIDKIIAAVLEHFGFTDEHADKVKNILNMIQWEEVEGNKVMMIRPGKGIEIRVTQPEKVSGMMFENDDDTKPVA